MASYEYKSVPAPNRAKKAKDLKGTPERFALSVDDALNAMAADGWEFLRSETLPVEERKGLKGTQKSFQSLLIFRREVGEATIVAAPQVEGALPPLELGEPEHVPERTEPPVTSQDAEKD